MDLTITLTDLEYGNIAGWVNYYKANPQYIGLPTPPNPTQPPTWQTRIVLESQTRARFEQIAAQFAPTPPVDVTVIQGTWGTIARYLTANFAPFKCNAFALQFTVPSNATNDGKSRYISVAESNGPPTLRQMILSETKGDFVGGIAANYGTQATINLGVGGAGSMGLVPGRTYFMNFRNYSPDTPGCTCNVNSCNASVDCVWEA